MSRGLGIVLTVTFIQLGAVLVGSVSVIALIVSGMEGISGLNRFTVFGLGFLAVACAILSCVGQILCCAAPEESRAKPLAITAVICSIAALVIGLVSNFVVQPAAGQLVAGIIGLIGRLIAVAGLIFFLLFLRAVARFFTDESLVRSVNRFFIFSALSVFGGAVLLLAPLVILTAATRVRAAIPSLTIILFVVPVSILVCLIIWLIWYLRLVRGTRDVIRAAHGS